MGHPPHAQPGGGMQPGAAPSLPGVDQSPGKQQPSQSLFSIAYFEQATLKCHYRNRALTQDLCQIVLVKS